MEAWRHGNAESVQWTLGLRVVNTAVEGDADKCGMSDVGVGETGGNVVGNLLGCACYMYVQSLGMFVHE